MDMQMTATETHTVHLQLNLSVEKNGVLDGEKKHIHPQ